MKKTFFSSLIFVQIAFLLSVILLAPVLAFSTEREIEGRVFDQDGPMENAVVSVYTTFEDIKADKPFKTAAATDANGFYKMKISEGEFYFVAKSNKNGERYFAYHGSNPIKIESENLWLTFMTNIVKPPVYKDGPTALTGIVTYKGKPIDDAYIAVYRPGIRQFKGLGFRTESILANGTFTLPLPAGEFVVVAKKMIDKKRIRPLKEGDLFCYYPENPVEVQFDKTVEIEVPCYPKRSRTAFVDTPEIKDNDFTTMDVQTPAHNYGLKGKITDLGGKPVPNIFVMAHHSHTPVFMMFNISHGTEYVAETDEDGNYFVPINEPGDYYVIARNTLGGGPHRGDIYGLYGGNAMHVIPFNGAELINNVDIVVSSALDEMYLKKYMYQDSGDKQVIENASLTDYTIEKDTLWKGKIEITGTVLVKRGITLTIEPGTEVTFVKIDRDNNQIGDGEITVEGRIVAKGTKDKKIIFKSAAENPETKDWAYILVLATASDNVFEYCEVSHAFTGMQIHYSNARISDCNFDNNHEGLRFNRTNLVMEHTTFINNDIGFRFARLEGRVFLRNNLITKNEVGALFMRPHVNTVDFNAPQINLEPPVLMGNSIYGNSSYDYKIGDRQSLNVDIRNNWWGNTDPDRIADKIFDKNDDNELGEAIFEPFLKNPVQNVGIR